MTPLEVFAAITIAVFTMTGGVLLNAAITSPRNCLTVIELLHGWVRSLLTGAIGLIGLALINHFIRETSDNFLMDPLLLIAVTWIMFFGLFLLAKKITMALITSDVATGKHGDEPHG